MMEDYLSFVRKMYQQYSDPDLVCLRIGKFREYFVFDPNFMRQILIDRPTEFPKYQESVEPLKTLMGQSVMNLEGDIWRHRRLMLAPIFQPKASLLDGERACIGIEHRLRKLILEEFHVETSMIRLSLRTLFQVVFSISDDKYLDLVCDAIDELCINGTEDKRMTSGPNEELAQQKIKAKGVLDTIVDELILSRDPVNPGVDVLGRLLSISDSNGNKLTKNEVRDECLSLLIAGHVTTAASLTWWAIHMAQYPEAQKIAAKELVEWRKEFPGNSISAEALPYLAATLKESMRLRPAAAVLLSRVSTVDTQIGPYEIPAGSVLRMLPAVLHLDSRWFIDAEQFKPERFLNHDKFPKGAYLPYGVGPRICIGLHLANSELLNLAASLLEKLSWSLKEPDLEIGHRLRFAMLPDKHVFFNFQTRKTKAGLLQMEVA